MYKPEYLQSPSDFCHKYTIRNILSKYDSTVTIKQITRITELLRGFCIPPTYHTAYSYTYDAYGALVNCTGFQKDDFRFEL